MANVAMLSFWHVHGRDYARADQNHPGARITVVWDEDAERGKAWAEKPMEQWIRAIETGTPPLISLQDGRDLTELMETARRSHAEGRPIDLPL